MLSALHCGESRCGGGRGDFIAMTVLRHPRLALTLPIVGLAVVDHLVTQPSKVRSSGVNIGVTHRSDHGLGEARCAGAPTEIRGVGAAAYGPCNTVLEE